MIEARRWNSLEPWKFVPTIVNLHRGESEFCQGKRMENSTTLFA